MVVQYLNLLLLNNQENLVFNSPFNRTGVGGEEALYTIGKIQGECSGYKEFLDLQTELYRWNVRDGKLEDVRIAEQMSKGAKGV